MIHKLLQSILVLILLAIGVSAQVRQERESLLQERALKLEPFIDESARRFGLDPRILRALCFLESRFRPDAVSPKGARGPMQFMPATASKYGLQNPHDPKSAIDAGAHYFRDLLRIFNGRVDLALAAYNAGEGTVQAFLAGRSLRLANGKIVNPRRIMTGGIPPYAETQEYVRSAIMFLLNKPTRPSSLRLRYLGTTNPSPILLYRDFTLDVLAIEGHSSSPSREMTSKSFIEIR
jgi:soluble lytic murein transglycosylase-like protein